MKFKFFALMNRGKCDYRIKFFMLALEPSLELKNMIVDLSV